VFDVQNAIESVDDFLSHTFGNIGEMDHQNLAGSSSPN